jgi:hypothetical protein
MPGRCPSRPQGIRRSSVALTQYEYGKKVESGEVDDPGFLFSWREPKVMLDDLNQEGVSSGCERSEPGAVEAY